MSDSWKHKSYSTKVTTALTVSLIGLGLIATGLMLLVGFLGLDGHLSCSDFILNATFYVRYFCLISSLSERGIALFALTLGIVLLIIGLILFPRKNPKEENLKKLIDI